MKALPLASVVAFGLAVVSASTALAVAAADHRSFAPTPQMGWNSWDNFGTAITGQQARE